MTGEIYTVYSYERQVVGCMQQAIHIVSLHIYMYNINAHRSFGELIDPRVHNIYREESIQLSTSLLNTLRQVVT